MKLELESAVPGRAVEFAGMEEEEPVPIGAVPDMVLFDPVVEDSPPVRGMSEISPEVEEALRLGLGVKLGGSVAVELAEGVIMPPDSVERLIAVPPETVTFKAPDELGPVPIGVDVAFVLSVGDADGGIIPPPPVEEDTAVPPDVENTPETVETEALELRLGVLLAGTVADMFDDKGGIIPWEPVAEVMVVPSDVEKTPVPAGRELLRIGVGAMLAEVVSEMFIDGGGTTPEDP